MINRQYFTILGCSASQAVPHITGDWGSCNPYHAKNYRTRCSFMVCKVSPMGYRTTVIIDTGPDFYTQMVREKVSSLDAVLYTHPHADHLHGIDDLRGYFVKKKRPVPIYADATTMQRIGDGFGYCLETPAGSHYPPIVEPFLIEEDY